MVAESGQTNETDTANGNTLPAAVPFPLLSYTDIVFDSYADSGLRVDCPLNRRLGIGLRPYSFIHTEQVGKSTPAHREWHSHNRRCTTRARSTPRAQTVAGHGHAIPNHGVINCPEGLDGSHTPLLPFRIPEYFVDDAESGGAGHLDAVGILDS